MSMTMTTAMTMTTCYDHVCITAHDKRPIVYLHLSYGYKLLIIKSCVLFLTRQGAPQQWPSLGFLGLSCFSAMALT